MNKELYYDIEESTIKLMRVEYKYSHDIPFNLIDALVDLLIVVRVKHDKEFFEFLRNYEIRNNRGRFPLEEN